ncbi:MAG: ABC transporter permease [Pseudopedobacter sp.]|nr:ABC transporter permease [Deinococcales bacterium]
MTALKKTPSNTAPSRFVVWYGELTTSGKLGRRGWLFALPGVLWLLLFLILPGLAVVAVSFAERGQYGDIQWNFTLENYSRAAGNGIFGWSADTLLALARSLWTAGLTTVLSILLAFPLAFFIASRPEKSRYLWLTLVIVPFWTNLVIRAYAWMLLLSPESPITRAASSLGLVEAGAALYPSDFAIAVGMLSTFLPFVVLPLYSSVERLDWSQVEAAQDLYGRGIRVFMHGILPQVLPGLTVAVILTFVPAMGMFVIPDLLGGGKFLLVGNLIQQQFGSSRDWPYGAALSLVLVLLTLVGLHYYRKYGKGVELV